MIKDLLVSIVIFAVIVCILAIPRLLWDIKKGRRTFGGVARECKEYLKGAFRLKKKDDTDK